ncbi:glutamate synthase-related protein [Vibrio lentus]|nr:glutamate synthase-related protein [Vibrio lentus]
MFWYCTYGRTGCKFLRICHLNNCATGGDSSETLRREYFQRPTRHGGELLYRSLADEVRQYLAVNLAKNSLTYYRN